RGQLKKKSKQSFDNFVSEADFKRTLDDLKKMEEALRKIDAEQKNNKKFSLNFQTAKKYFPKTNFPGATQKGKLETRSTSNLPGGTSLYDTMKNIEKQSEEQAKKGGQKG